MPVPDALSLHRVHRLDHLKAMRAFEATARHLSFSKAARELCVTQGALSHHVAMLEAALGAKLFLRYHRAIELTPKGELLFRSLREAFDLIEDGVNRVSGNSGAQTLRIKLPPTFAIRWLIPKLAKLHGAEPHLDVQITTSHRTVDFIREDTDVAIYSGVQPPAGLISKRLFGEVLTPVCSPEFMAASSPLSRPADLTGCTLLCSLHRPLDWPLWLAAVNVTGIDGNSGLKFENSSLAYQAAIDKLGIALAQIALVADDLKVGRLVQPFTTTVATDNAYFIVYPSRSRNRPNVRAFEEWLLSECVAARIEAVPPGREAGGVTRSK
jgi:LysR family glycine cleavage system transcriptional activator